MARHGDAARDSLKEGEAAAPEGAVGEQKDAPAEATEVPKEGGEGKAEKKSEETATAAKSSPSSDPPITSDAKKLKDIPPDRKAPRRLLAHSPVSLPGLALISP